MGSLFSQNSPEETWRSLSGSYPVYNQKSQQEQENFEELQNYQSRVDDLEQRIISIRQKQVQIQRDFENRDQIQNKNLKMLSKFSKCNERHKKRIKDMEQKLREFKSLNKSQTSEKEQFSARKKQIQKTKSTRKNKTKTPLKSQQRKSSFESIIKTRRQIQQELTESVNKKLFNDN